MATCKDCVGYNFCSRKRDGETDYLGKEIGCGNVEDLCGDFKNKADVVPVVRCKDCKHYKDSTQVKGFKKCAYSSTTETDFFVMPDDFCNYGEGKD